MLDDAADVPQGLPGQLGILVAAEERLVILPQRLVHVHTGAVLAKNRLIHDGRRLTTGLRDIEKTIFKDLDRVGAAK